MKKIFNYVVAGFAAMAVVACSDKGNDPDSASSSSTGGSSSSVVTSSSETGSSAGGSSSSEEVSSSGAVSSSSENNASSSSENNASSSSEASSSSAQQACAPRVLRGTLTAEHTYLCADSLYELSGFVVVGDNKRITIEAGTRIASEGKSALIVMPGGKIYAVGTPNKPIVFTSKKATPAAGDWAGVVIFGKAPVSTSDRTQSFEADANMRFGGNVSDDSSGVIKYVRIEYAGWEVATDKELNGLTLGGVGSKTVLDYIQVHEGSDDAIEFFGGTVSISHSVVTAYHDDGWDIDEGWQGKVEFGINIQGKNSDRGIEAGSKAVDQNLITKGEFVNVTIINNQTNQAIHIKDNVALVMKKSVLIGAMDSANAKSKELVRLEGDVSIDQVNQAEPKTYFEDTFYDRFNIVAYAGAYEKDASGKVIKYYKDASGASQVCPGGNLPADAPAGASCSPKIIRDSALEADLMDGLTQVTDMLNNDLSPKASQVSSAGAGAIVGNALWYAPWVKEGTVALKP